MLDRYVSHATVYRVKIGHSFIGIEQYAKVKNSK